MVFSTKAFQRGSRNHQRGPRRPMQVSSRGQIYSRGNFSLRILLANGSNRHREAGADLAPGQPGLEPLLPMLDAWSPSYEFVAIEA
jgi:hypothetical protein